MVYNWPGNVRELENVIERAVILTKSKEILIDDLPLEVTANVNPDILSVKVNGKMSLDEIEKNVILSKLKENDWNQTKTANDLNIGMTTLWRKIKKYNLRS